MPGDPGRLEQQRVPRRALAISFASLAIPVGAAIWLPDGVGNTLGTLTWLTALIPAFLLAYYRGLAGVAVALAGGMAVITATQVSVVTFDLGEPNWPLLAAIVGAYLAVSLGIGTLAEVLRRERRSAEAMALLDRLTGLPNRRYADLVLEQEFAAAARGRDLTVVLYDLDRFKSVNDRFGHSSGDSVIRAFAQVLKANTRRENVSARFGGEEFIAILRDTDADAAAHMAQRVLDQTRELTFPWGHQTVSAGVAAYEHGMGSYELLVGAADRALYLAKEGGRDMLCVAAATAGRVAATMAESAAARPEVPASVPTSVPASVPANVPAAVPASVPASVPAAVPASVPAAVLAAVLAAAASVATRSLAPASVAGAAGQLPRVYVVDDDQRVVSTVKRMLHGRGMIVWGTADPDEAIRSFAAAAPEDRPALIITDIIMPTMTGTRMMEQIAKVRPDIPVIYMSGYVHGEISWSGMPGSVVAILEKPIMPDKMREVVDRALSDAHTTGPAGPQPGVTSAPALLSPIEPAVATFVP